ncbi:methyltransferase, FkbM family [Halorubrum aquaticum]|uniref:Methyltransferase, FkbM family n=1 Tax=Halorubrum aquaticum TaxID=387340 RepID=A0A1I3C3P5_9EURY|nr:FkbM family methyltransferase [Halorubrum aquaticum]SFH69132.1 methyltransferase, FkbM family [Halorubrum aquaticum]
MPALDTPAWLERVGFRTLYRLADLTYALGVATPKRTVAGTYWSYEPTNPHGDDPGLAALDRLPNDATVLDVGAHVGEHAIPLAVGTDRRVVAFEPNGESADRLVRNAARNGLDAGGDRGIDLRRAGLGDERGSLPFYRSTFSKCSAFDRDRATRWGARVAAVEEVPVYRLDDLVEGGAAGDGTVSGDPVPAPDAIKVDVEGHEPAVLRGAETTIRTHRPLLVVEVHEAGGAGSADGVGANGDPLEGVDDSSAHAADHEDALRSWLSERGYDVDERDDVWVCRG